MSFLKDEQELQECTLESAGLIVAAGVSEYQAMAAGVFNRLGGCCGNLPAKPGLNRQTLLPYGWLRAVEDPSTVSGLLSALRLIRSLRHGENETIRSSTRISGLAAIIFNPAIPGKIRSFERKTAGPSAPFITIRNQNMRP